MKIKNKVAILGIIVQVAGLIYGIVNNAEDVIVICLIFLFISTFPLFDKKKFSKQFFTSLEKIYNQKLEIMTIYALSTGPGLSGVAIIRISGSDASSVIKSLTIDEIPKPRMATLRKINNINTSELID